MPPNPRYRLVKSLSEKYDHPPKVGSVAEVLRVQFYVGLLFRLETGDVRMTVSHEVLGTHFERIEEGAE